MKIQDKVIDPDQYYKRIKELNVSHYAGEVPYYTRASLREVEKVLLKKLRSNSKVLDLGCGSGRFSLGAAMHGFNVTGVDITPEAISAAQHEARGTNANFIIGDMTELDFEDETFDYVFCPRFSINAVATLSRRKKAVSEMLRVVNESGLVLIESLNKSYLKNGYLFRNILRDLFIRIRILMSWLVKKEYSGLLPGDITYRSNKVDGAPDGYAHLPTALELKKLIPERSFYKFYSIPQIVRGRKFDLFKYLRYSIWVVIAKSEESLSLFDNFK